MEDEVPPLSYPKQFGERFVLVRKLGEGAYSTVYLAKDRETEKVVAIKFSSSISDTIGEFEFIGHLEQQLETLTAAIPTAHEYGIVSADIMKYHHDIVVESPVMKYQIPFMVMPYYDSPAPFAEKELDAGFFFELFYALYVMDKYKILHEDLHANNVIGTTVSYSRCYIIDGTSFVVDAPVMPVIIDWVGSYEGRRRPGYPSDVVMFLFSLMPQYPLLQLPDDLTEALKKLDFGVLTTHPLFQGFRGSPVEGEAVRIFKG